MRLIAGDIGGTKTILRLVEITEAGTCLETLEQAVYSSGEFPDLVPIVKHFLLHAAVAPPKKACFAIAGPVLNNTSQLTNLNWFLEDRRLQEELYIEKVSLINDFAAVSYGILKLETADLATLQPANPLNNAPIAVIGAGTGLGEGFLIPQGSRYQIFATEGGHADFAPRSQLEWELLEYLQNKYQIERVSVERVVSGQGIAAIYQFLRDRPFAPESPTIGAAIRNWEKQVEENLEKSIDPASIISQEALAKSDSLCIKTMEMFIDAYGAEAGNLALKLLPYGGLYIAGGIAAKNLPFMKDGRFISAFKQKGRVSPLLERTPVHVVLNQQVGLLGSVLYAINAI